MPIYEFHCEKCDKDSEILVRSADWEGTRCPQCGSTRLSKKFSVFASAAGDGAKPTKCMANSGGCGCGRRGAHKH